jgi:hypothetical protein
MSEAVGDGLNGVRERVLESLNELPQAIDRYRIRGELGRGGMGIVYDAHDPELDRPVAIKLIHPRVLRGADPAELLARFAREMRATSQIFQANVVSILDAGVAEIEGERRAYYVMERVPGPSLEERLRDVGELSREETLRTGAAIARGLAAVHAAGLVHRDLKPSNVLLPLDGSPKISDFGLCSVDGEGAGNGSGGILGTAHYMAPEQVRREPVSPATDLFALGAILMRMRSGREPFLAASAESHFYRVLHDAPDGIEELDADLAELVLALLAKDPKERPASAAAVAERLASLAGSAPGAPARGRARRLRIWSRTPEGDGRRRTWIGVSALLALLAGAAIAVHNDLVSLERDLDTRWKQVENQLVRQAELIPRLYALTERYVAYEREAREQWLAAARALTGERALEGAAGIERALAAALGLAQAIPELEADAQFRALSHEIAGTKNRIAVERARYNEAVGLFNRRLEQLPWRMLALGRAPRPFFQPPPELLADPGLGNGA